MKVIFLDIDGVLNCELFYKNTKGTYVQQNICSERVSLLNDVCKETSAKVVISSTWRMGKSIDEMIDILNEVGATFEIIGMTPVLRDKYYVRGNEIQAWIEQNEGLVGAYYDYHSYAILDDDSDMLYWQRNNFFQVDAYAGLTPNICYKVRRFLNQETFPF